MTRNTALVYVLSFIGDLFFPIAVWMFYYLEYISFSEVAVITAVGTVSSVLLEIPTGAIADRYGRKLSIVLSYAGFAPVMLLIAFFPSFPVLLVAAVLASLVNALYSGSLEALIYDSLKEQNKLDSFPVVTSRLEALAWVGLFAGAVIGGWLYIISPVAPYIAQAVITGIAGIAAFFLVEPKTHSAVMNEPHTFRAFAKQNMRGFQELFATKKTAILSVLFITTEAGYMTAASILGISQAREYGIAPEIVGIIFGIGYLFSAGFSYIFPYLSQIFGNKILLSVSTLVLLISFFAAPFVPVWFGVILIIARIASSTTFRNIRSIMINQVVSSQNRATSLSTLVLLSQLPYTVFAWSIGWYIEQTSPNQFAFVLGGVLLVVLTPITFLYMYLAKHSNR